MAADHLLASGARHIAFVGGVSGRDVITPRRLLEFYTDRNPARAKAAFEAMMTMHKIDIAAIEAAADRIG